MRSDPTKLFVVIGVAKYEQADRNDHGCGKRVGRQTVLMNDGRSQRTMISAMRPHLPLSFAMNWLTSGPFHYLLHRFLQSGLRAPLASLLDALVKRVARVSGRPVWPSVRCQRAECGTGAAPRAIAEHRLSPVNQRS